MYFNLHKLLLIFHNVNHLLSLFPIYFPQQEKCGVKSKSSLTQFLLRSQRDFSRLRLAIPELQYRISKFHSPARQGLVKKRLSSSCIYSFNPSCLLDMRLEKSHSTFRYLQITFSFQIPILWIILGFFCSFVIWEDKPLKTFFLESWRESWERPRLRLYCAGSHLLEWCLLPLPCVVRSSH